MTSQLVPPISIEIRLGCSPGAAQPFSAPTPAAGPDSTSMRANVGRLAALLKECHTKVGRHLRGPANAFWVFHVIRDYVRLIDADPRYLAVADRLEQAQVPLPIVFGHHDLLPGNFMGFHRRRSVLGVKGGGVHNKEAIYDAQRIRERARLIGYGIDARRQRFRGETPHVYKPHADDGLTYRWDDKARADIKDYNLLDLSI